MTRPYSLHLTTRLASCRVTSSTHGDSALWNIDWPEECLPDVDRGVEPLADAWRIVDGPFRYPGAGHATIATSDSTSLQALLKEDEQRRRAEPRPVRDDACRHPISDRDHLGISDGVRRLFHEPRQVARPDTRVLVSPVVRSRLKSPREGEGGQREGRRNSIPRLDRVSALTSSRSFSTWLGSARD
jgi:hypothetical protein